VKTSTFCLITPTTRDTHTPIRTEQAYTEKYHCDIKPSLQILSYTVGCYAMGRKVAEIGHPQLKQSHHLTNLIRPLKLQRFAYSLIFTLYTMVMESVVFPTQTKIWGLAPHITL